MEWVMAAGAIILSVVILTQTYQGNQPENAPVNTQEQRILGISKRVFKHALPHPDRVDTYRFLYDGEYMTISGDDYQLLEDYFDRKVDAYPSLFTIGLIDCELADGDYLTLFELKHYEIGV